jgi:hypothetical protein
MSSSTNEASLQLAERFAGRLVEIQNHGWIIVPETRHGAVVKTGYRGDGQCRFHVESIPGMPGVVAFRVQDTNLYLTNIMYGDEHRQAVANALASVPGILADNIASIVDYTVGRPTDEQNFEGAGFNYSAMTVLEGPPNKLQMFQLERGFGVRSLFGTYWRSQWWDRVVSQSPHLLGDETWRISVVQEEAAQQRPVVHRGRKSRGRRRPTR